MDIEVIIDSIAAGEFDTVLEPMVEMLQARREMLREQQGAHNKLEFVPGTRVETCGNLRPRYLLNIQGTVSYDQDGVRRGDLRVHIDELYRRRMGRYSLILTIPASCLRRA
jgi:hypothetical protein